VVRVRPFLAICFALVCGTSLAFVGCGTPDATRASEIEAADLLDAFASADKAVILPLIARLPGAVVRRGTETLTPTTFLLEGLQHPDRGVREWSAHALGDLSPHEMRVVDALLVAFDDEDDWVRWKAVRALGCLGPFAKKALPLIEPAAHAQQETEVVRAAALVALRQIGGT